MKISNSGMSKKTYEHIVENISRIKYDLEKGIVITPKGTNGTVCATTGYLRIKLNKKVVQVHQILAVLYFGEKCVGLQVNHKDGNKLNNLKNNLEVVSKRENIQHAFKSGLYINGSSFFNGSEVHTSKLNEEQVIFIRNSSEKNRELADKFKVHIVTIRDIKNYKTWKHIA